MAGLLLLGLLVVNFVNGDVVELPQGKVRGTTLKARNGRDYLAFFGIPYAKPPVGNLRLKNPEPLSKWEGELDGTQPARACLQMIVRNFNSTYGDEDCLKLNVFTPTTKPKVLYPVLLFIHEGGFRAGQAPGKYGAGFLLEKDVVVITIQYRLGLLGFLSTEDEKIPGNFGLKDQSMAINWAKENVRNFGGDPDKIAIYGESAGAASVHYQALTKLNKDIVKLGISGSGVINGFWAAEKKKGDALKKSKRVFTLTGCNDLECLQTKSGQELQNLEREFMYWDMEPIPVFKPVIEPEGKGAFLTVDPFKEKVKIPWLTGFSTDEGLLKIGLLERNETAKEEFLNNTQLFVKKMFDSDESKELDETVEILMDKYFKHSNEEKFNGLKEYYTYVMFLVPIFKALKNQDQRYVYVNNYKSDQSFFKVFSGGKPSPGVSHSDLMGLVFNYTQLTKTQLTPEDELVSQRIVKLWVDSANLGEKALKKIWKNEEGEYLEISKEDQLKKDYKKQDLEFWMNLPFFNTQ